MYIRDLDFALSAQRLIALNEKFIVFNEKKYQMTKLTFVVIAHLKVNFILRLNIAGLN